MKFTLKEVDVLMLALQTLVEIQQDTVDYTELRNKLLKIRMDEC